MKHNIFTSTKHWKFTRNDEKAEQAFVQMEKEARSKISPRFYQRPILEIQEIRKLPLYKVLKTIPKGVMHHSHFYANDDVQFLRLHVVTDARMYLSSDLKKFQIGTIEEAKQKGWISMKEGLQKHGQKQWLTKLGNLIAFSQQQMLTLKYKSKQTWNLFESKLLTPLNIYFVRDIFQKYTMHYLLKYIQNGYDRVQMRALLSPLSQYDENGKFLYMHPNIKQKMVIDEVVQEINKKYPLFSYGFINVGFKINDQQKTLNNFRQICDMNWDKLIGFDFVQEQDKFDSLERYDKIVEQIYEEYPHLSHLKKIYHAGETSNHLNNNIDIAVKAGSVRLGHGINILQRAEFLTHCKNICFEKNPVSNLLLGYNSDLRQASAPILLGLGHAVSISPDDPGKFGLEDSTGDYFAVAVSYNWTLRHLKLVGYHSINHAVCEQQMKKKLIISYEKAWNQWVLGLLPKDHDSEEKLQYHYEDIFTFSRNWSFNQVQQEKNRAFLHMAEKICSQIPQNVYQQPFSYSKDLIRKSDIYEILKTMPKGTLQSCHFFTNHDSKFFLENVLQSQIFYYNEHTKQIQQGSQQKALKNGWISSNQLMLKYETLQEAADFLYSITSFTKVEIQETSGHAEEFWKFFNKKYKNLMSLLCLEGVFRKYVAYTLQKLANLGYSRAEFRMEPLETITEEAGESKVNSYDKIIQIVDQQYAKVQLRFPIFTIGFIILGNKHFKDQQNRQIFDSFCSRKWDKMIGFDFFQNNESQQGDLSRFDSIVDNILQKYDDRPYEKLYQAGNTNDHINQNLSFALKSGSKRILNGLSITQDISLLKKCSNVCFETNPILNIVDGASNSRDIRLSIAPILLGLGFPISINSYFSGMIGLQDPLFDLFFSAISFNFSLKHLKLIILHSINYSCSTKGQKQIILKDFHLKWNQWVSQTSIK